VIKVLLGTKSQSRQLRTSYPVILEMSLIKAKRLNFDQYLSREQNSKLPEVATKGAACRAGSALPILRLAWF